mgnify:FL=1
MQNINLWPDIIDTHLRFVFSSYKLRQIPMLIDVLISVCDCDAVADACDDKTGACLCRVQGATGDVCEK